MVKYIVQRGDTLGNIAYKYGTSVQAIAQANGIRNPNMIHKGQIIRIPSPHYDDKHHHDDHHDDHHMHNWHHDHHDHHDH